MLRKLFDARLFTIPNYQRFYDWTAENCQDLLSDLQKSSDNNNMHFMSTIVGLKSNDVLEIASIEYDQIDIVDGQQRITTLIILYKAISKQLGETDEEKEIKKQIDGMLVKYGGTKLILQSNHKNSDILSQYIQYGTLPPETSSATTDQRLKTAIEKCEKFVQCWKNENRNLSTFVTHLNNNVNFVYYVIDDVCRVYSIFETLNSRGLAVTWFDRLKTMLMGIAVQQPNPKSLVDELHKLWGLIYEKIGIMDISKNVLRFTATLYETNKSKFQSESKAAELLKCRSNDSDKLRETTRMLLSVAKSINKLYSDPQHHILIQPTHIQFLAVAIDLSTHLSDDEKTNIWNYLKKIAFFEYAVFKAGGKKDAEEYLRLGYNIYNQNMTLNAIKTQLATIAINYIDDSKIDALVTDNCYKNWQNKLRYLLYNYEKHLAQKFGINTSDITWDIIWKSSARQTVEHISPQKDKDEYRHWLGNLFLLPPDVNNFLRSKKPIEKGDSYTSTGLLIARDIIGLLPDWNESTVLERGKSITSWMKNEWVKDIRNNDK